jgi:hypothetical protein
MCVIAYSQTGRCLTKDEFENCFDRNRDGVGIAYQKSGNLHYIKGLMKVETAWDTYQKLKLEGHLHVVHFRIGTAGGKTQELTHPFLVSTKSPLKLSYSGRSSVLFHNGCITRWEDYEMPFFIANKFFPEGEMSDSRMAAMLVSQLGLKVLTKLSGKFIIFSPDKVWVRSPKDFEVCDGILFSNNSYKKYGYGRSYKYYDYDSDYGCNYGSDYKKEESEKADLPVTARGSSGGGSAVIPITNRWGGRSKDSLI